MHFRKLFCTLVAALVPLMTMASAPAHAQQYEQNRNYGPVINGFNVEEVPRLTPGVELHFDLYGSPGGTATLRIDGATRNVHMTEV